MIEPNENAEHDNIIHLCLTKGELERLLWWQFDEYCDEDEDFKLVDKLKTILKLHAERY